MTQLLIGFLIALAVGLTGIGGGSFTVPVLLLFAGLSAGEAVGTAFIFAGVVRLLAAPFYLFSRQIHLRYFWLLLRGAIPGLLAGTLALRYMTASGLILSNVLPLGSRCCSTFLRFARVGDCSRLRPVNQMSNGSRAFISGATLRSRQQAAGSD